MECPNDGTQLTRRIYEGAIEIDECPNCRGIWLDRRELYKIQNTVVVDL